MKLDTISMKMFDRLGSGRRKLGEDASARVVQYVNSQMTENFAFVNKKGEEDLYYTFFGLTLSHIFGLKINTKKLGTWLKGLDKNKMDLIHYSAYVRCMMMISLIEKGKLRLFFKQLFSIKNNQLPQFTGYPHDDAQSPYSLFILLSLMEDLRLNNEKKMIESLQVYKVSGGGYSNIKGHNTASTNPTVAALSVIGQLNGYLTSEDVIYLKNIQDKSGGFSANAYAPVPDLLSTATSLFMLNCYGIRPLYNPTEFIEAHWLESGGFSATIVEDKSDMEYTFYGLLALGSWK